MLRVAAFGACLALFFHALAQSDLAGAWARIRAIGPIALVILVPFPLGLAFDVAAWRRLLAALERRVPLRKLYQVRLVTEAVNNSAPAGVVWSEAIAPVLVAQRTNASVADAFAASTAKRWLVVRTHGLYVALSVALGWTAIAHASSALLGGRHGLPFVVLVGAALLVALSLGIETIAARAQIAGRVSGQLGKIRFPRLRAWIEARHHQFEHADAQLGRLADDHRATAGAMARVAMLWLFEGLETFVILHLLGARLGWIEVISFDAALSVARSAAFFAPSGIGVQDVGYLAVLQAYGVPDAATIGPAFVVLKRAKESFWILVGFVILGLFRRRGQGVHAPPLGSST